MKEEEKIIINKINKHFEGFNLEGEIKIIVEKVRGGYVVIETRPRWDDPTKLLPWTNSPIAKFIFHNPSQSWRIYWMRASRKWQFYESYKSLDKVLKIINEDKHGCFWG